MTEIQTTDGMNGDLHQQEHAPGGSSDDEECLRACADADTDPNALNRCQDIDDEMMCTQSPSERRRSSIGDVGTPGGKRGPPRAWPPTSPTTHGTTHIPSKPLVRRGSLKGKVWPPPGYNKTQAEKNALAEAKARKGPPRQWPPPPKSISPIPDEITDDVDTHSINNHSQSTDFQNDDSYDQSGESQNERNQVQINEELSEDHDNHKREENGDLDSGLLSESYPESPLASRGTPFTMSPSPPATPEPRSDPSPSPRDSPKEDSPRSASPDSQDENEKS